ncbi:MAG: hypothetical protein R2795_13900 [Saprospiraceae bacterium]
MIWENIKEKIRPMTFQPDATDHRILSLLQQDANPKSSKLPMNYR